MAALTSDPTCMPSKNALWVKFDGDAHAVDAMRTAFCAVRGPRPVGGLKRDRRRYSAGSRKGRMDDRS
jgi:hypothetical protein